MNAGGGDGFDQSRSESFVESTPSLLSDHLGHAVPQTGVVRGLAQPSPALRPARDLQPLLHHVQRVEDCLGGHPGQGAAHQAALHGDHVLPQGEVGPGDEAGQEVGGEGVETKLEPGLGSHSQAGGSETSVEGGETSLAVEQAPALPAAPVDGPALSHQAGSQHVEGKAEESSGTTSDTPAEDVDQGSPLWMFLQLVTTEPGSQTLKHGETCQPVGDTEDLGRNMTCRGEINIIRGGGSLYLSTELSLLPLGAVSARDQLDSSISSPRRSPPAAAA